MNIPYYKLNINFNLSDIVYTDRLYTYGKGYIQFYKIQDSIEKQLLSYLPVNSQKYFKGQLMIINGNTIKPHTDSDRLVAINFYIKPNNAITVFWEEKENLQNKVQVNGQTNGYVYNTQDLILKHKFVAEPNSVYILDVSKIHSVYMTGKEERLAFCLASKYYNYDQTIELFEDRI